MFWCVEYCEVILKGSVRMYVSDVLLMVIDFLMNDDVLVGLRKWLGAATRAATGDIFGVSSYV